jgi:hypothetical protein
MAKPSVHNPMTAQRTTPITFNAFICLFLLCGMKYQEIRAPQKPLPKLTDRILKHNFGLLSILEVKIPNTKAPNSKTGQKKFHFPFGIWNFPFGALILSGFYSNIFPHRAQPYTRFQPH